MNEIYLIITKGLGYIAKKYSMIKRPVLKLQDKMTVFWLKRNYRDIISKYKAVSSGSEQIEYNNVIWTCWWQGEKNAPETVKICIESMRRNKGDQRNLIVIDQNNYDTYISLPSAIMDKFKKKYIRVTQLVDIIRVTLLEMYGGLWLDASILVVKEIPDRYFGMDYWTIKKEDNSITCISKGKWTNGAMASCREGLFVGYVKRMLLEYWGGERILINYFLVDCITHIAFKEFEWFQNNWRKIEAENDMFGAESYFNTEYTKSKWNELVKRSCFYFMTRKKDYLYDINGRKTFYGYIRDYYRLDD